MRILHIIYDDIDNPWLSGGGATRTLEIYSRIAAQGHGVEVICGSYPGASYMRVRRGVYYRHIGLPYSYVLSRLTFMVGAARLIKRGGYDIVIEDVSPFSPVGAPLWQRTPTSLMPSIASVQNLSGKHATRKYRLWGLGPRLVEKPLLSLFKHFVAVSPGIAAQLRETFGQSIDVRVIPNSAGWAFFSGAANSTQNKESDYVLSLGRIDVYQKGLDRLIEAFDRLADRLPNVRLLVAGSGTEQKMAALRSLASGAVHTDKIELLGQVSQERAAELVAGALMLAMPSRYEAWPLTAIEAGAAGVPVVGSDIVGVRDAAPPFPEAHGVLAPEGDLDALTQAMYKTATDPALRAAVRQAGRAWAARFTWDALAQEQLEYYRELVGARKP